MKRAIDSIFVSQRTCFFLLVALSVVGIPAAHADLTDLSNQPLANVSGTVAVKPNVMFILDDSGSMQWDYVPDYVGSAKTGLTPKYTAEFGDPPYNSAHFNKQYYSPNITYLPPVGYDGSSTQGSLSLVAQDSTNTSAWTAVRTDGFNKQNKNQLGNSATTVNIVTGYPDRVYCTSTSDSATDTSKCKTNSVGFTYADGYSTVDTDPYTKGKDGSNNVKYRYGPPYYYNILPAEYCSDEALTLCQSVTPGSSAPSGFPYAAKVRWCNSSTAANAATPSVGDCQGKRVGSFTNPRFFGTTSASVSHGRIVVGDSGSDASVSISDVKINNVSVINSAITASTGTNSALERQSVANEIVTAINNYNSTPEYHACAGAGCNSIPYSAYNLGSVNSDTVVVVGITTPGGDTAVMDSSRAGFVIEVIAPEVPGAAATGTLKIKKVNKSTDDIFSIKVGPSGGTLVDILGGTAANLSTDEKTAAKTVCEQINASGSGYLAYNSSSGSVCNKDSTTITIEAPSGGSQWNGFVIDVTASSGITTQTNNFSGGASAKLETTLTNFLAGSSGASSFQRVDIVASRATYPKAATRSDCVTSAGVCTYAEEMTNFANWYAYYRTRNQAMKSAAGRAFLPLGEDYRLGFNTINNTTFNNSTSGGTNWLTSLDLTSSHKDIWYTKLYATSGNNTTPLRGALARMGKYYEGTLSGANSPIQYSCQQNFAILTTDGYWNETYSGIGNEDNVDSAAVFCTRANGCYDGGTGASSTLSDVAAYYYKNDLRTDLEDNVPVIDSDPNPAQHMTTFTLGLGVDGVMTYRSDYDTAATGDYYRVRTGDSGCQWTTGTCNWPVPSNNTETAVDDLWHAAASGHGRYFSAQDPASLSAGLSGALQGLQIRTGAAAASSTSTPNITQEDNYEFSATFRTVKWDGELVAQNIDITTGATLPAVIWSAREQLNDKVGDSSDSRTIYTTEAATPGLRSFTWDSLSSAEQDWFSDRCAGTGLLAQCVSLGTDEKDRANSGEQMVKYLRGQQSMESYSSGSGDPVEIYRARDYVLGDIAGSKPAYVAKPRRTYTDAGYSAYVTAKASRESMVYAGANDGMLHAFRVANGQEKWAYVPRMLMPEMYKLASTTYGSNHRYFVDGSPSVGDVYISGAWKTILVGGLNKGGRGYYALDITDPDNPHALWEICSDSTLCPYRSDSDMGYTFGEPVIAKRPSDGKWVVLVSSGYNNVSPGDGKGYLYVLDAENGAILNKISTNVGTTTTPSGLAKLADYVVNPETNNTALLVYGGDVLGNLWRFDLSNNSVIKLAYLTDPSGQPQPITARPETGSCGDTQVVFAGTGRYLGTGDVSNTQMQSVWGIKDSSSALGTVRSGDIVQQSLSVASGGYKVTNNSVDFSSQTGWFVDLDQNTGERVNLDPVLVNGNLLVVTNQPTSTGSAACGTGGKGFFYQFSYCKGAAPDQKEDTVMGTKVADSIVVGFIPIGLPSGSRLKITTADGNKPQPVTIMQAGSVAAGTRRVDWRELTD